MKGEIGNIRLYMVSGESIPIKLTNEVRLVKIRKPWLRYYVAKTLDGKFFMCFLMNEFKRLQQA